MRSPFRLPGVRALNKRLDAGIRWRADEQIRESLPSDLARRLDRIEAELDWLGNEVRRIAYQVAASEVRLADLDDARRRAALDGRDREEGILELISAEHARVRERLSAVARYEERLRRLEAPEA